MLHLCATLKHRQDFFLSRDRWHTTATFVALYFQRNSTSHRTQLLQRIQYVDEVKLAQQNSIYSTQLGFFFFISSMTGVGLIFRTRTISRIPLPFRLISMICSLIWGNRPKSE